MAGLDGAAYGVKGTGHFGRAKTGRAIISVHNDRPGAFHENHPGQRRGPPRHRLHQRAMAARLEIPNEVPRG